MATEIIKRPEREHRSVSTADGGTALSTTATVIGLPTGTTNITLLPRNFSSPTSVWKWAKVPWLTILKTTDALATTTNLTDASVNAQDGSVSTSVTLSSLSTLANGDALYVGSYEQFRGVNIDIDAANGTASVLTVDYWDGDTWADTSATDGTTSGGATFAIDGSVTWTVPSAWAKVSLRRAAPTNVNSPMLIEPNMYWTRWSVSVALDSSTTLDHMLALSRSTAYAELLQNNGWEEALQVGPGGYAAIEALVSSGTANLIVNASAKTRFA